MFQRHSVESRPILVVLWADPKSPVNNLLTKIALDSRAPAWIGREKTTPASARRRASVDQTRAVSRRHYEGGKGGRSTGGNSVVAELSGAGFRTGGSPLELGGEEAEAGLTFVSTLPDRPCERKFG